VKEVFDGFFTLNTNLNSKGRSQNYVDGCAAGGVNIGHLGNMCDLARIFLFNEVE